MLTPGTNLCLPQRHVRRPGLMGHPWRLTWAVAGALSLTFAIGAQAGEGAAERAASLPATIAVEEVRPGQQGHVLTVLRGTKPVASPVTVLGVVRTPRPQEEMVLVRLEGEAFQRTGVILGMSGSPVYIEGRLAGAVSHAWAYAKEPIAGVTPIANMLRLLAPGPASGGPPAESADRSAETGLPDPSSGHTTGASLVPFFLHRAERTLGLDEAGLPLLARGNTARASDGHVPAPLPVAVSVGGLPTDGLGQLSASFQRAGFVVVTGGTPTAASSGPTEGGVSGAALRPGQGAGAAFEPGGPIVVQLVRGDIEISALGTVTAVMGDRVLGFGHPVFGQAGVELPLATASVKAVIPSQQMSLKLWSVLREVGATETDGQSGLSGRLGRRATTIPVTLAVSRRDVGRQETYHLELARHPLLTPDLLGTVVDAVLAVGGSPGAEASAHLVTTVTPAGFPPLHYDDWYSGPNVASQVARELTAVPEVLLTNPFGSVEVEGVSVSVEVFGENRLATIESLSLEEVVVRPGDRVKVEVTIAPYREPRQRRTLEFQVPQDAQPGPRILVVGDARSEMRLDVLARRHHYEPRTLPELVTVLREEFKQTRLYGRVSQGTFGVAIRGVELANLPASMLQTLSSPLETDRSAIIGCLSATVDTPWVLTGVRAAYLKVTEDKEKEEPQ